MYRITDLDDDLKMRWQSHDILQQILSAFPFLYDAYRYLIDWSDETHPEHTLHILL